VSVVPGSVDRPATYCVGADAGSAGTWLCLNHLTRSTIRVHPHNLRNPPDEQGHVHPDEGLADELSRIPASGDLTIDVGAMPEQFMNLAIVAAHRAGTTRLVGGTNLRIEESDRIAVMARELHNVGVDVDELPDGLVVRGGKPLRSAIVDPDNDHRVAMAFALAGLMSPGISIANPECVARSHPGFWDDLERVRTQRRCIAVVGMRGAGKSTFARAFAAATECGLREIDDRLIEGLGPIEVSMATYGWTALRKREERLVGAALAPNGIVSLRGAAVESSRARELLRSSTSVIWLDCDATLLRARIAADAASRSSVTGAPVLDEIPALLARRNPLYAEVADVRIDAALPTDQQVESTLLALGASCRWPGSA
jgi:shikimate kinase